MAQSNKNFKDTITTLQLVLDTIPVRVFWKDKNLKFLGCNKIFAQDAGFSDPHKIIGKDDYEMAWKELAELYRKDDKLVMQSLQPKLNYEEPQITPSGKTIWLKTSKIPLFDSENNLIGIMGTYEDVSERRNLLEELRLKNDELNAANQQLLASQQQLRAYNQQLESSHQNLKDMNINLEKNSKTLIERETQISQREELFRNVFTISPDAMAISQMDGVYTAVNRSFCEITGFYENEILGKNSLEIDIWANPEDKKIVAKRLKENGYIKNLEAEFKVKSGIIKIGLISASVIMINNIPHVLTITRDITDLKKSEQEISKKQKLDSLGILAGGIAHDFNNLLSVIYGYFEQTVKKCNISEAHSALEKSKTAYKTAKNLTYQLLTFSKGGKPVKEFVNLGETIKETANISFSGSNVTPVLVISQDIKSIYADKNQLIQVFNNIFINARQSMPLGGEVKINAFRSYSHKNISELAFNKNYIKIEVKDQGFGISKKEIDKIFDPFYTTKQSGTGLGLSISYSIVKNHGGTITVESKIGEGSVFAVYLPFEESNLDIPDVHIDESAPEKISGTGVIIVMEDNEFLAELTKETLLDLGYEPLIAYNGEELLEHCKKLDESKTHISVALIDLTIKKGMGGKEAVRRMKNKYPDIKAVVTSGYSSDPILSNPKEYGFETSLKKPYTIEDLSSVLNKITGG